MSVSIDDLAARLAALEGRMATVEAKVKPSDVCIYAGQEYGLGSVIKQADNQYYKCNVEFGSGNYQWDFYKAS